MPWTFPKLIKLITKNNHPKRPSVVFAFHVITLLSFQYSEHLRMHRIRNVRLQGLGYHSSRCPTWKISWTWKQVAVR